MKKLKQSIVVLLVFLLAVSAFTVMPSKTVEAKSVNSVVKTAKYYYNDTNKKIKKGKKGGLKKYGSKSKLGLEVWKTKSGKMRKVILYGHPYDRLHMHPNALAIEYYFDKNEDLVFMFAYDKVKGKIKEERWYFSRGKLWRYISPKKKTTNYKKGKRPTGETENKYSKGLGW